MIQIDITRKNICKYLIIYFKTHSKPFCCQEMARLNHKEPPLHMHEDGYNQNSVELQLQLDIN